MRFGIRIGPFWVSSSTRRRSRGYHAIFRDEYGRERRCEHNHRTLEAAEECARRKSRKHDEAMRAAEAAKRNAEAERVTRMSAEEYRQHSMEADPEWAAEVRRKEAAKRAQVDADLQRMKDELGDGGEAGA